MNTTAGNRHNPETSTVPDLVEILKLEWCVGTQVQSMQAVVVCQDACQVAAGWQLKAGRRSCGGVQPQQGALSLFSCSAPGIGLHHQLELWSLPACIHKQRGEDQTYVQQVKKQTTLDSIAEIQAKALPAAFT